MGIVILGLPGRTLFTALLVVTAHGVPADTTRRAGRESVEDAPLRVRFREGVTHGFLELFDLQGRRIADGTQLQMQSDNTSESRLTFRFSDGSLYDERARYTQDGVFRLRKYHMIARGPAYSDDVEATFDESGTYDVTATSHKDNERHHWSGKLDLPPDVYNGMTVLVAKNLPPGTSREIHMLAFTPKPMLIRVAYVPTGRDPLRLGGSSGSALHYTLKPKIGAIKSAVAHVIGESPPDAHMWIVTNDAPAFVRFQGPLGPGPVWRIDLSAPRWR
ncbi:MAG TPA: hypothetical protein VE967_13150 [Gemmatimonadaceae bacterium]|nr:hypothetical protein [Gemmatimonadaceae bacterium]